jgi:hypothetical protein
VGTLPVHPITPTHSTHHAVSKSPSDPRHEAYQEHSPHERDDLHSTLIPRHGSCFSNSTDGAKEPPCGEEPKAHSRPDEIGLRVRGEEVHTEARRDG